MPKHPGRRSAFLALAFGALVALMVRRLFPVRVEGRSMSPTLLPGDLIACSPAGRPPRGGKIVVVQLTPPVIKRVARATADEVFLIGDNSTESTDSRSYGPVSIDHIRGVARAIYWPPARWRLL
jgi:signal peptidase I